VLGAKPVPGAGPLYDPEQAAAEAALDDADAGLKETKRLQPNEEIPF
jgi:hypothetical protein